MPLNYSNATEPYHIWVPRDPLGGIPWVGYLGGTDGTLGPMGPWDRWDLGLKDPRYFLRGYFLRVVYRYPARPGPARPAGSGCRAGPVPATQAGYTRAGYPGRLPGARCRAGSSGENFRKTNLFFGPGRSGRFPRSKKTIFWSKGWQPNRST